jgi:glycosyltransferase involved in cell wall biosynthesis
VGAAPAFSVVMAAYNAGPTIEASIESLLAQTFDSFELIVVDDGSTDDTTEKVKAFEGDGRVTLVRQPNFGLAAARNTGIAVAGAELVSMLDSDDLWLPTYLERMKETLDREREAAFAYTDAWIFDDITKRIHKATAMAYQEPPETPPPSPEQLLRELLRRNFIFTSTTVRKPVLDEVGGFDLRLHAAEDYELWLRLAARGHRAASPGEILAVYRLRPNSLSRNALLMMRSLRQAFEIVTEEYELTPEARAIAEERKRELRRSLTREGERLAWRYRLHAWLIRRKIAALGDRLFVETPPAEVSSAFPNLAAL